MLTPRDYQSEDVSAVLAAHQQHQCVIGRAATGLGKAVEIALLAEHYAKVGRVMVLVDVTKLVRQLAATVKVHIGIPPGVEMGESRAHNGERLGTADRIVVSTVQTQYSGEEGRERYRQFDPAEFSALLLDECELFLAPKAREVVEWYRANNPEMRVFGCTATPMRTDGTPMADLFNHVAFDRDIIWGIENGWLVPARQAFVRVSLDFSTLKVRKGEDGEADYSEAEIAERINNEATLVELAKGIIHVAEDRKSIVVCPDVATARAVAHYLEAEKIGCAGCVYGELGDEEKEDVMNSHQRGEFQFLTSVMMLTKGYDDFSIRAVFNCRKTKSRRLYAQILGRGTRPWRGILQGIESPNDRRTTIVASQKPDMLMVNLVGVSDSVRDVTLVDILGKPSDDAAIMERARELNETMEADAALEQAREEIGLDRAAAVMESEAEAARLDAEDEARDQRRAVQVQAHVEVEYCDDLRVGGGYANGSSIASKHLNILRKAKLKECEISALSADQAKALSREIVARWKTGLCSYRQATLLQRCGFTRDETRGMTFEEASRNIEELKQNNWRRERVA